MPPKREVSMFLKEQPRNAVKSRGWTFLHGAENCMLRITYPLHCIMTNLTLKMAFFERASIGCISERVGQRDAL